MKDIIFFNVFGKPQPKARPRVTRRGIAFTPESTRKYEEAVRKAWKEQSGKKIEGDVPLVVMIVAEFPIPESLSKKRRESLKGRYHTKRGDCDNVAKSILDALNTYAFDDDSQVAQLNITKRYSFNPKVQVIIGRLEENEQADNVL